MTIVKRNRILHLYISVAYLCIAACSVFTVTNMFMDNVLFPKWIMTAMASTVFLILSLPFVLYGCPVSWNLAYKYICQCINFVVFCEALFAVFQLFRGVAFLENCRAGSFDNVAGLTACLCITSPLGFVSFSEYTIIEKALFVLIKCFSLFVLIIFESRIGCICILTSFLMVCLRNRRKQLVVIFSFIVAVLISSIVFKTQSSLGRWFVLTQTFTLILQSPLFGHGTGGFTREYMDQQANYFLLHPNSQYELVADNIHHPLNEFLLLTVNFGVTTLLLLLIIVTAAIKYFHSHKSVYSREGVIIMKNVFILSLFSYPFKYPFTYVVLFLSLCLLLYPLLYKHLKLVYVITYSISICILVFSVNEIILQKKWSEASCLAQRGLFTEAQKKYQMIYPHKKDDYIFLYDYALEAYRANKYNTALKLAKEANISISDYYLQLFIADIYQVLHKYDDAIVCYQQAHYMCPNRFSPLYEIYRIYSHQNDTTMCLKMYEEISDKPIKVKGQLLDAILKEINADVKRFYH